ncbi:MAG: sigma-54 dependent transcriptional regulator [Paracoccaceae bacterium]|uniref:sigma-54-dependent transcriptional regulator n=1 Tax=Shimia thalassica TaxID=1715693 RepID=UPI0032998C9C
MKSTNILIIDDEINLTRSLAFTLRQAGMECSETHNGRKGCEMAKDIQPDIILLDIRMPGMTGLEVLEWVQNELPDIPVVMMSAYDDTQDAVTAMKMGAVDYLSKPFDVDELILLIKETDAKRRLQSEVRYLREKNTSSEVFIGNSPVVKSLKTELEAISKSKTKTMLLLGETGVGKAIVAREIHVKTVGADSPFVEVNCATLVEGQIEAELFGAERGALPGLVAKRKGLIEIADGGTLFLDEIGDLPLPVQAKLLTFLETRSFRSLGMGRDMFADVSIIAATNRDLKLEVEKGNYRQDLYFRLNVVPIHIPPLKDRDADVELLSTYFAQRFAEISNVRAIKFDKPVGEYLRAYSWPGNVRELRNLVERLTILHAGQTISVDQLPTEIRQAEVVTTLGIEDSILAVEKNLVLDALRKSGGKKGVTADLLGISRHALKRKLQKLGLS